MHKKKDKQHYSEIKIKKVFICSPLRGDTENNQARAKKYASEAVKQGYMPIVPHIYFTQFLDDNKAEERQAGIQMGIELLKLCDEVWIYGKPTEGMKQEIKVAKKLGIKLIGKK